MQVGTSGGAVDGVFTGTVGSSVSVIETSRGSFSLTTSGGEAFNWNVTTFGALIAINAGAAAAVLTVNSRLDARLGAGAGSVSVRASGSAGTETIVVRDNVPVTFSRTRVLRLKASRL